MTRGEAMSVLVNMVNKSFDDIDHRAAVRIAINDMLKYQIDQDNFQVGDEVVDITTLNKGVCTRINLEKEDFYVMWSDGSCGNQYPNIEDFKKTGRNFQRLKEIIEILNN